MIYIEWLLPRLQIVYGQRVYDRQIFDYRFPYGNQNMYLPGFLVKE